MFPKKMQIYNIAKKKYFFSAVKIFFSHVYYFLKLQNIFLSHAKLIFFLQNIFLILCEIYVKINSCCNENGQPPSRPNSIAIEYFLFFSYQQFRNFLGIKMGKEKVEKRNEKQKKRKFLFLWLFFIIIPLDPN
jgi:hypothetical protein